MKTLSKLFLLFSFILFTFNTLSAQEQNDSNNPEIDARGKYLGIGLGFDYGGGIGAKLELVPVKHLGLFGGLGYNFASISGNVGVAYKISPEKKTCPNILMMYGYNGSFKGDDSYASQYDVTSYGVTLGVTIDFMTGSKGDKMSLGIFVPIRSKEFTDKYNAAKDDLNLEMKGVLLPFGISFGYNFKL